MGSSRDWICVSFSGRQVLYLWATREALFVDFLMMATLTSVKWYLIVGFNSVSVIMNYVEHLFMCLLAICLLWRNVCLGLLPSFWLGCLFFWSWVVWAACIFWKLILSCSNLLLFSPILRVVFSHYLQFPLLCKSFKVVLGPACLFLFLFPSL